MYTGPVIDPDVHHGWKSSSEILAFLPRRWRDSHGAIDIQASGPHWPHFHGVNKRLDTFSESGDLPGTDYATLKSQLLDPFKVEKAMLSFDIGLNGAIVNNYLADAVVRAINDWNAETWLSIDDDRLVSAVLVPTHVPEEGAAEIRRVGRHPKIKEALIVSNTLGKPFGHPVYHPIYRAAAEMGLPIAIHSGGDDSYGTVKSMAGGMSNTRLEFHVGGQQSLHTHLASFITHGVFEQFPTLKLLIIEIGVTWLPWFLMTMDQHYSVWKRESPWVRRLPSDYVRQHVRVTTQPMEVSPRREQLIDLLSSVAGIDDILCYASDYPHWDADDLPFIARLLPDAWWPKIFHQNARDFYGLADVALGAAN